MGKTLYLIKQTATDTDASYNAEQVLNTVLDAIKDKSTTALDGISLSTHSVTSNYAGLLNSDIYSDIFDSEYSAFVSEYSNQIDFSGAVVTHTNNTGYHTGVAALLPSTSSANRDSAPLYDSTIFVTTNEQNTAYTNDSRFKVDFDEDVSGTYQVFKAVNSATYRKGLTSGLTVEEVQYNVNAGLSELFIIRDPSTNELSIDGSSNPFNKLTSQANTGATLFTLSYHNNIDVSYGSIKVVQKPSPAFAVSEHANLPYVYVTDASYSVITASQLNLGDEAGRDLSDNITGDQLIALFSAAPGGSGTIGAGYSLELKNTGGGGYFFNTSKTQKYTSDDNITIDDNHLVPNFEYMKTITDLSFVGQKLVWTNGTVVTSGTDASNITIGVESEELDSYDYDVSGTITFFGSDATYSTNANLQRSYPDSSWNLTDTLNINYAQLADKYKIEQKQELNTRVLLPSTYSTTLNSLGINSPFKTNINDRFIDHANNLVFIKSGPNNVNISPASLTVSTSTYMDNSYSTVDQATIFEFTSALKFTNQSTLLKAASSTGGSYSTVDGATATILAHNVVIKDATDYRFRMNPKQIAGNSDSSFNFPDISGDFSFVALVDSSYSSTNELTTLKSNMNIFGNDIYEILANTEDVDLTIAIETNGTATNSDSLKNFFTVGYSYGSHDVVTQTIDNERVMLSSLSDISSIDMSFALLTGSNTTGTNAAEVIGCNLYTVVETTTFVARTQLYLAAYSNLYVETPTITQVDTRYEIRTADGAVKPDHFLRNTTLTTDATRILRINNLAIPVNSITLSSNDLKSHIGVIEYTESLPENITDTSWNIIGGPNDVDPNFDNENYFADTTNGGYYRVYIDVPKTMELNSPQHIISMQEDAVDTFVTGHVYSASNEIFTAGDYAWDLTTSNLTGFVNSSRTYNNNRTLPGITHSYVTNTTTNIVTITVKQDGNELFNVSHFGDIIQNLRVIYNPRGIVQTKNIVNNTTVAADTRTYFGDYDSSTIRYKYVTGTSLNLDRRYRDTLATSSFWTFTNDNVSLVRVNGNYAYIDLSSQYVGIDGNFTTTSLRNPKYGGSDGAKSVTFKYYRGNSNGLSSIDVVVRTPSSMRYVLVSGVYGESKNGNYLDVYTGFTDNTVPVFDLSGVATDLSSVNVSYSDFGLRISGTKYSILSFTDCPGATATYQLYMNFDTYRITEKNPADPSVHNSITSISTSKFVLFTFDGPNESPPKIYQQIVALVIKGEYLDKYTLTNGTTIAQLFYNPQFVGSPIDLSDSDWTPLTQGVKDTSNNLDVVYVPLTAGFTENYAISYEIMGAGIYLNNGAIRLERISAAAGRFTGYFVCPPPQLKVSAVVITKTAKYLTTGNELQRYDVSANYSYQNYDASANYSVQSHWVDVDQRVLDTTYNPLRDYVSNIDYYMNNLELYEVNKKTIRSYRSYAAYSEEVAIQENKFNIYEYSGMYMSTVNTVTPLTFVSIDLSNALLSSLASSVGSVAFDATTAAYTVNLKQRKDPLTLDTSRYSYENLTFTIGSGFLLNDSFDYYSGDASGNARYEDKWVPIKDIGNYVMKFEYNVGHATRLSLYGTRFSYSGDEYTLTLNRYRTSFGVDYSNYPREINSVVFYANEKSTKTITHTRPDVTTGKNINTLIGGELSKESWSDASYAWVVDTFTPGNIKFELYPSASSIFQQTSITDGSYNSAGEREILSILSVTGKEPRQILFMKLEDSVRVPSVIYGDYVPKNMTTYSGKTYNVNQPAGNASLITTTER